MRVKYIQDHCDCYGKCDMLYVRIEYLSAASTEVVYLDPEQRDHLEWKTYII